ncbi:MAG: allose kinase [Candidatus Limiplasma sp.]|nr:allose kinase [Candidatus Limiplasma sp.]MEA5146782.1 allose kinase [Candidatus Limiplasma sp.]
MLPTILGMDIGGTNLRSGFVDERLGLTGFRIHSSQQFCGEHAVERLADYIRSEIKAWGTVPTAVAIGFPSTLDRARKRLLSTPNLEGLDDLDMVDELTKRIDLPVFIDRDVNLLFHHDCHANHLSGQVIIGCYIGTGLGNVIAIGGEILVGKNGVAAELGHIPVRDLDADCPCGNVGCVEMIASGKALKALQEKHYPKEMIADIFVAHGSEAPLMRFINDLALPIATELNILDPDEIILGGGVLQMEGFPKAALEAAIRFHTRKPYPERALRFHYSCEKQENGVIGAGLLAFKELKRKGMLA